MKSSWPPASIDLREHTGSVRRRRWIVLGGVIIGIVGGLAYAEVAPKTYTAVAAVYILKTGANQSNEVKGARAGGVIDLDSEAQVVTSAAVASAAGNLMGTSLTPSQLPSRSASPSRRTRESWTSPAALTLPPWRPRARTTSPRPTWRTAAPPPPTRSTARFTCSRARSPS